MQGRQKITNLMKKKVMLENIERGCLIERLEQLNGSA